MTVHDIAKSGFNTANELYDRLPRQSTSSSAFPTAFLTPALMRASRIASGTGIFTRCFLAHPEWQSAIKQLRAVEPSEGMRNVFSKTVSDERVSVTEGTFQQTGIEDGWADLVVIAQAFHWCPDYERASEELGRILKPGGVLALIWNVEDSETAKWVAQVRDCIQPYEQDSPQYRLGHWRRTFGTTAYQKAFERPQEEVWSYHLPVSGDIVVDRASTKSYVSILPDDEKAKVRRALAAIVERGEDKVWIKESEGTFAYPYKTNLVIACRKM
ncbi:S-adenosyl-L-methionine-dependent methyltransferase [Mycena pura]|uniref:S-adenosyl-L-methionine-dependent methyltransferase n=1 Tax=Mycena pura TaxID=153505 RepID=A0AAD6VWB5_9AGAR|nr:S-adenosyl-L-methionine-dependent methyltransferase [Mycena pura]